MVLRIILLVLAWLLLALHFLRADINILAIISLLIPLLLLIKKKWAHKTLVILTIVGALEWVRTSWQLINARIESGDDWKRMAIILFSVALFTLLSAVMLNSGKVRKRYNKN